MNFALTDEQEFLQEAARGALGRFKTVESAREAHPTPFGTEQKFIYCYCRLE